MLPVRVPQLLVESRHSLPLPVSTGQAERAAGSERTAPVLTPTVVQQRDIQTRATATGLYTGPQDVSAFHLLHLSMGRWGMGVLGSAWTPVSRAGQTPISEQQIWTMLQEVEL